jgi:hypothetical protein
VRAGRKAPRGVCPVCLRSVAGRVRVRPGEAAGMVIIRSHKSAPRVSWTCPGSHRAVPEVVPGA